MMEPVAVRRALPRDESAVASLLAEYNVSVRRFPPAKSALADQDIAVAFGVWLAEVADQPAGCILLRTTLDIPKTALEVKRLYVRPRWRRRGIAGSLLDAVETCARDGGFRWLYLDSREDMREALRLYRARGFKPIERYNQNTECSVFMRKPL